MNPVEKARIKDATQMRELINSFADRGDMLPRPLSEIYESIKDFFVVRRGERVIACVALHISWSDLAEIRSLVVLEGNQKQRIGNQLVDACLNEARELGISTVFCLSNKPAFFEKCGFSLIDKAEMPHKAWSECYRCPKFPDCDEAALVYRLEVGA